MEQPLVLFKISQNEKPPKEIFYGLVKLKKYRMLYERIIKHKQTILYSKKAMTSKNIQQN